MSVSAFPELAAVQEKACQLLAHGASLSDVAASTGLHRSTVYRWIKSDDKFHLAMLRGHAEYTLTLRDDLRELSEIALRTVMGILIDPLASAAVRLKTAVFILNRPESPKQGWAMPVPILEPEENVELTEDNPLVVEDEEQLRTGVDNCRGIRRESVFSQPGGERPAEDEDPGGEPDDDWPQNAA